MSLETNEFAVQQKEEDTLDKILKDYPNIIVDPGINWCSLHQVTEDSLERIKNMFVKKNIRYEIEKTEGLLGMHLANRVSLRDWYNTQNKYPGKREKERTIWELEKAKLTKEFTGIAPSAYDSLLKRLREIPDTEDIVGYSVRYHM